MADKERDPIFRKKLIAFLALPLNVLIVLPFLLYFCLENFPISSNYIVSIVLLILGIGLVFFGSVLMFKTIRLFSSVGKGTLAPWNPTQKLVTEGPYQYSRNPMITGVVSNLIGLAFITNHIPILCWALLFFFINHIYFILKEEPLLEKKFGEDYVNYFKGTPRWVPKKKSTE